MLFATSHPLLGTVTGRQNDGVAQFLGLKYATVQERFAHSELFQPTAKGMVDATRINTCPISPANGFDLESSLIGKKLDFEYTPKPCGTDGLNLNISVPLAYAADRSDKLLPVLVFIHGGGFSIGSNWYPQYNQAAFSSIATILSLLHKIKDICSRFRNVTHTGLDGADGPLPKEFLAHYNITETTSDTDALSLILNFLMTSNSMPPRSSSQLNIAYLWQNYNPHLSSQQRAVAEAFARDVIRYTAGVNDLPRWGSSQHATSSIPEVMQSLNHLVAARKVLYLGISGTPAWVVVKLGGGTEEIVYFDSIRGEQLDIAIENMNLHGRIVACGFISQYKKPPSEQYGIRNTGQVVGKQLTWRGFNMADRVFGAQYYEEHVETVQSWIADGSFDPVMSITKGIDNAATGLVELFEGRNIGKAVLDLEYLKAGKGR
ncbi:hypothetical protein BJY04DRAFT_217460 [Aspergillus karnatakaensis]|uniref:uncharacterized protein n=1 Tax=Aspergillus karnatakaensis TaxID=1810916 RepID=UPI003CCE1432